MRRATVEAVVCWQRALDGGNGPLEITFHGGEPLVPGSDFYRMALPLLRDGLAPRQVRFGVQSNLWLLTDELCDLFREYGVSIGTSLDGPETINDAQRGQGYFRRTMDGIERARVHGLNVGCICTFTAQSALHADEVFDFFLSQGLGFSIHAALPALGRESDPWVLPPEKAGPLFIRLLERYVENLERIRISTLDAMCRSLSVRRGGICTFGDCLGNYLAVDPEGWIYPCQRLAGRSAYRLGNVHDCPTLDDLAQTPAWRAFRAREERIAEVCAGYPYVEICRGGCPY
ncbi:MAG: TIGR04083 family peptide-modifying radical SAM enzyme, partial [Chloroflexi bacterium]